MNADIFNRIAIEGTGGYNYPIRLASDQIITVTAVASAETVGVYLPDTIQTPNSGGWGLEDPVELWLTSDDQPMAGRLFCDVPATDVLTLIRAHGGEHADQNID
ncbi:hypothetical protein [Streptomyces sp. TE5632]